HEAGLAVGDRQAEALVAHGSASQVDLHRTCASSAAAAGDAGVHRASCAGIRAFDTAPRLRCRGRGAADCGRAHFTAICARSRERSPGRGRRGPGFRRRSTVEPIRFMPKLRSLLAALLVLPAVGCSSLGYYGQAISGQFEVYRKSRPVAEVIADPATDPRLRAKLADVQRVREFASRELGLPDNDSYRVYADLGRRYVLWNVFATPELSLEPLTWCFPVSGCVAYRGYFSREAAEAYAEKLRAAGYDVHVGGGTAYSTLGWFSDPLLNTMIHRPLPEIAGLLFHELAHQRLYVRGDTAFSESFAMTVELEGVRRWLEANGEADEYARYARTLERRQQFTQLVLRYRDRLEALYAAEIGVEE